MNDVFLVALVALIRPLVRKVFFRYKEKMKEKWSFGFQEVFVLIERKKISSVQTITRKFIKK